MDHNAGMRSIILVLFLILSFNSFAQLRSDQIPYPFYIKHDQSQNQVMNVESGIAALELRLEMIRRAKKSIVVEYFIYNTDLAGRVFTRELVAAAQRGVEVRILIDKSLPIFEFDEYYAKELDKYGIKVRYYNDAPLISASTVQFRNHRKLLAVDDLEAITGGRNIGDDYFDLSPHFNFNDRDIYVKGPVAETMRLSFDLYFENEMAERPRFPNMPKKDGKKLRRYQERTAKAEEFLKETEEEVKLRERLAVVGQKLLNLKKMHVCPETTYSTDAPGANFSARINPKFDKKHRFLRKTLFDKISVIDKSILISSPYLLNNIHSRKLMNSMLEKNVKIDLYTNSLASTDAIYVAANLYLTLNKWRKKGINIYLHDGQYIAEHEDTNTDIAHAKWGTHCKTQIFETSAYSEVMIGTYNVDNRSNYYNSEMAVFCKGNEEFTKEVRDSIMSRAQKGIQIHENGKATDKNGNDISIYGASEKDVLKMKLITIPSWLLKVFL